MLKGGTWQQAAGGRAGASESCPLWPDGGQKALGVATLHSAPCTAQTVRFPQIEGETRRFLTVVRSGLRDISGLTAGEQQHRAGDPVSPNPSATRLSGKKLLLAQAHSLPAQQGEHGSSGAVGCSESGAFVKNGASLAPLPIYDFLDPGAGPENRCDTLWTRD